MASRILFVVDEAWLGQPLRLVSGGREPVSVLVSDVDLGAQVLENYAALRNVNPVSGSVAIVTGRLVSGDGGFGWFLASELAAPGTYVDDGAIVLVPAGGDGSVAWLRQYDGNALTDWWGAVAETGANVSAELTAAITAAKTYGYDLLAPWGVLLVQNIALGGGTREWSLSGRGKAATEFRRFGGGTVMNCSGSSVPFGLRDFAVNGRAAETPAGASHGISIGLVSGVRVERVKVTNYAASAGQIYDDAGAHRFRDCWFVDCESDGLSAGQVGFLIANLDDSGIVRCTSARNTVAPGYGLELKNECRGCHITDSNDTGSLVSLAFGQDGGVGVQNSTVTGCVSINPVQAGWISGLSANNVITGLTIDLGSGLGYAIRSEGDTGNSWENIVVKNLGATRTAAYFLNAASDNYVEFSHIDNINVTGKPVEFAAGTLRNRVVLRRMSNPIVRAGGVDTEANWNGTTTNSYRHDGWAMYETVTIAAGVATPLNQDSTMLILAGEGGAADQLDTLAAGFATQGKVVTLKCSTPAQPITVANPGNISPAGGVSFVLDDRKDTFALQYHEDAGKWCELSRSNNG